MKSLKEIRLVYRQHLLPPLVVPFDRIADYLKLFQNSRQEVEDKQKRSQLQKMIEIHETIMTQLMKIKNTYIKPLMASPLYYDLLDQNVKAGLLSGKYSQKTYLQVIKSLSTQERFKIYNSFQNSYNKFKQHLEEINPNFYQKVVHLPVMKYESPQDIAFSLKKNWNQLSEMQQEEMRQKYISRTERYWVKLSEIAEESQMSTQQLVELIKNQVDPPLSSGLKKILFS